MDPVTSRPQEDTAAQRAPKHTHATGLKRATEPNHATTSMHATTTMQSTRPAKRPGAPILGPDQKKPATTGITATISKLALGCSPPGHLTLTYHVGSLFSAPHHTVLIHACNARGVWGSGIARIFKNTYPKAYKVYYSWCQDHVRAGERPTGECFLIPPMEINGARKHWIACLVTSERYGDRKDPPDVILRNTAAAVKDMLAQVKDMRNDKENEAKRDGKKIPIRELRMCKINSGKFGVPWEETEKVLRSVQVKEGEDDTIQVWAPASEE